jgi:UDP-glucose 4-epimerase
VLHNKVLVTGGCGFIGSNLISMLEDLDYQVNILDNLSKGSLDYVKKTNAKVFVGDIRDEKIVSEALKGVSSVIHLAAYGSVVESVIDPMENFDINVTGSFTVLNECRKSGVKKIIFSSTGGALIGNTTPPVSETSLPRPISPYGSSKLCFEAYCSSFACSYSMDITALRFANVVGPISWHKKGAVTAFMKAIIDNKKITIYGDGRATRDFLYVHDLCYGIIQALQTPLSGFNPIHLASGQEVSVKELADSICNVAKVVNYPIEFLDRRVGEVERNFADHTLASQLINFYPTTSFQEAIELTWNWFKSYKGLQ